VFFAGSGPRLYNEDLRPAEKLIESYLRVGSSAGPSRDAEKRWRYSLVDRELTDLIADSWRPGLRELRDICSGNCDKRT
jgi:hypothetical protein